MKLFKFAEERCLACGKFTCIGSASCVALTKVHSQNAACTYCRQVFDDESDKAEHISYMKELMERFTGRQPPLTDREKEKLGSECSYIVHTSSHPRQNLLPCFKCAVPTAALGQKVHGVETWCTDMVKFRVKAALVVFAHSSWWDSPRLPHTTPCRSAAASYQDKWVWMTTGITGEVSNVFWVLAACAESIQWMREVGVSS